MRIALVSHEYPPFRGGGIGTYATVMADVFARAGHQVHVVTNRFGYGSTNPQHALPYHREGNLHIHRVDALTDDWHARPPHDDAMSVPGRVYRHWSPYLYYAERVADELERIHAEHRLDVAEFPECAAEGFSAIRRKREGLSLTDLPMTVTLHSPIWEIYQYNLYSRHNVGFYRRTMMEEYTIRHADAINAPSGLLERIVRARLGIGADARPWDVLALPMDFSSIPTGLTGRTDEEHAREPSLLFVGRLEPRKGVRYLVDAAARAMDRVPNLRVDLVGKDCDAGEAPGTMTEFLRSRIPERWRGNFHFVGQRPRAELFDRYARATACVFAAPWDNFPLSCVEAMASGSLVIASDYTGMAEMIEHERSGLLFRSRDVGALTEAIVRAATDHQLARAIRAEAPARIRRVCDPETAATRRIEHYDRTIQCHRARRTVAAPRDWRGSVSALVPNHTSDAGIVRTVDALRETAARAGVHLDLCVVGTNRFRVVGRAPPGATLIDTGEDDPWSVRRAWLERAREAGAAYMLELWPWEQPSPDYLACVLDAMERRPKVAWATTWSLPVDGTEGPPYAGWDFSAPLELIEHHPVPFSVIRRSSLEVVGGWNQELPQAWADWDLRIAFEEAGEEGVVVPLWLGRYVPREEYALRSPGTSDRLTQLLEVVTQRSPGVFARSGVELWLFRTHHTPTRLAGVVGMDESAPTSPTELVQDWWSVTKTYLKRGWPGGARAYRRYVRRG